MLEYEYTRFLTELFLDVKNTPGLREKKLEALKCLYARANQLASQGFLEKVVAAMFRKKARFLIDAVSKGELKKILKPSQPVYSGSGFCPGGPYHVEEEELIMWSLTSLKAPLVPAGYERYSELFERIVGALEDDAA